ncbi:MAG TPA: DUF4124 domain-containing protein [Arenimonas sp.]|uniref:DUF4124 domain-containing protein n=1 Tax=Arenimonas sp. TaxID=1872635 RepID=UPI002D7E9825|nr:DUF4124 domain-containing protein [Arenimonas sp.]HEU0154363.1 DUF4124 domain-containing protein [Arenimonas sp.]
MSRPILILALAFALAPLASAAEKVTVYKSTGANGETVYSQVQVASSQAMQVDADSAEAQAAEAAAPEATPAQKACEMAQANLAVLTSGRPVQFDRDGDGTQEPMTEDELTTNRANAQRQVRAYCEPVDEG